VPAGNPLPHEKALKQRLRRNWAVPQMIVQIFSEHIDPAAFARLKNALPALTVTDETHEVNGHPAK
jgi:hypothetical protein